jgi:ATP-dependent DNA ligase
MKFKEAAVLDLPTYINDSAWILQQKVDGIRAQLVFAPGEQPWFRSGTGEVLKSSAAAKTTTPILKAFGPHPATAAGYTVDGEVLNGTFYAFDLIPDGGEATPLADRLAALELWHSLEALPNIELLPTARTTAEKTLLSLKVYEQGGEGWIAKRLTGTYDYGQRVEHSLKLKITTTVDCVVLDRNRDGKHNFVLGVYRDGALSEIGCASAIGKPNAQVGEVVEVKYLYVGADGRLTQPTVLRLRTDKPATDCDDSALRFVNKNVVAA